MRWKKIETLLAAAVFIPPRAYYKADVYTYMYKEQHDPVKLRLFNEALYVYLVNVVHWILFLKSSLTTRKSQA